MDILGLAMTLSGLNNSPFYNVICAEAMSRLTGMGYADTDDLMEIQGFIKGLNFLRIMLADIVIQKFPNA